MKQIQTQIDALWITTLCSLIVSTNVPEGHTASIFATKCGGIFLRSIGARM